MKCCAQSVKAAVRHSAGRRRGRFVGVSSARPAYFPGVPLPGCESGVWFRDYGPPSGAAYHDIGHRLRVKIKLIMPRRAAAEVASEARRGSSHHGCVHTAASKVIFRVAQCNTRTHFAALLATEQGEVARAACNAGAGTGPVQAPDVTTLTAAPPPLATLPIVGRNRKQPLAGTPRHTTGARYELYCEINRPPSLGAPSWRAMPDGSLYFGALC